MGWQETDKYLIRQFDFPDFASALKFVNKVGELAEKANHHPDIELSWGKVVIKLWTHSAGKVTDKDHKLAAEINQI